MYMTDFDVLKAGSLVAKAKDLVDGNGRLVDNVVQLITNKATGMVTLPLVINANQMPRPPPEVLCQSK